jgi:hypothetical protein
VGGNQLSFINPESELLSFALLAVLVNEFPMLGHSVVEEERTGMGGLETGANIFA